MEYAIWNGPLVPYVRTTQRQKWVDKRYKRYQAWKTAFRACLNTQAFPSELERGKTYELSVNIFASGKVRYDLDNAVKAVMDSAWTQDRQVKVLSAKINENVGTDYVEVTVRTRK